MEVVIEYCMQRQQHVGYLTTPLVLVDKALCASGPVPPTHSSATQPNPPPAALKFHCRQPGQLQQHQGTGSGQGKPCFLCNQTTILLTDAQYTTDEVPSIFWRSPSIICSCHMHSRSFLSFPVFFPAPVLTDRNAQTSDKLLCLRTWSVKVAHGRFRANKKFWQSIGTSAFVLEILEHGYFLVLFEISKQCFSCLTHQVPYHIFMGCLKRL